MTVVAGSRFLSLLPLSHASPTTRSVVHNLKLAKRRTTVTAQFSCTTGLLVDESTGSSTSASSSRIISNQDKSREWHLPPPSPRAPSTSTSTPLARLKHPAWGGQDLSGRYVRLERALRGKEGYEREIEGLEGEKRSLDLDLASASVSDVNSARKEIEIGEGKGKGKGKGKAMGKAPMVFAGYTIPEEPKPPEPDECCMSGCAVCVHDLYAEALETYEGTLDALRTALSARGVPESTWPAQIRFGLLRGGGEGGGGRGEDKEDLTGRDLVKAKQATLSAFEQMELQLAARRSQNQDQSQGPGSGGGSSEGGKSGLELTRNTAEVSELSQLGSVQGTKAKAKKTIRRGGPSMNLTGKAVMEAVSWVLFSRR